MTKVDLCEDPEHPGRYLLVAWDGNEEVIIPWRKARSVMSDDTYYSFVRTAFTHWTEHHLARVL